MQKKISIRLSECSCSSSHCIDNGSRKPYKQFTFKFNRNCDGCTSQSVYFAE